MGLAPLVAALLAGEPAAAARSPTPPWDETAGAKRYVGAWTLAQAGAPDSACRVGLDSHATIGGFQLKVPPDCARATVRWGDLYAWYVKEDRTIVFADAARAKVFLFRPAGDGWGATSDDGARLALTRVVEKSPPKRKPARSGPR